MRCERSGHCQPEPGERADGGKEYYINGKLHREGGLPAIERADGSKEYWKNGKLHREGGLPAIERANGSKQYYVNGKLHREGGLPAIERADGSKLEPDIRSVPTLKTVVLVPVENFQYLRNTTTGN